MTLLSSAKIKMVYFLPTSANNKKRIGPSMDPCSTLLETGFQPDTPFLSKTCCLLPDRKDSMQSRILTSHIIMVQLMGESFVSNNVKSFCIVKLISTLFPSPQASIQSDSASSRFVRHEQFGGGGIF